MWHPASGKLYWVDVRARAIYRLEADNRVTTFPLPSLAGGMVPRKSGGIAIALQNGFHGFDTATGALTFIADPEPDKPDNRVNDGSCDRAGRFWAGTQHVTIREPLGSLTGSIPTTACAGCSREPRSPTWCVSAPTTARFTADT